MSDSGGDTAKPTNPTDDVAKKEDVSVKRIAEISTKIREALRASLPTPLEQFLTVMVPGKVINTDDYIAGFGRDGRQESVVLPYVTELNQARLCDDMATLSGIQLGPTGRSVARSYASTLTKLVPVGTTLGISTDEKSMADQLSRQQKMYNTSMEWLTSEDPASTDGKTRVDIYVAKQKAYTDAVEKKIAAFSKALKEATDDPANKTRLQKRDAYDKWVNEHSRTWRNHMQAAYMDWVVNGKKEEVEYHFAIVDVDSAMARVEASKETMRASTVMETDGSGEYYKVRLDPSNWAYLAMVKADPGAQEGVRTVEWYTYEIDRLQKLNTVLQAAKDAPMLFKGGISDNDVDVPETNKSNQEIATKTADYFKAKMAYQKLATDKEATKEQKDAALKDLNEKRDAMKKALGEQDKEDLDHVTAQSKQAQDANFVELANNAQSKIDANNKLIDEYDQARQALLGDRAGDAEEALSKDVGIPPKLPDPQARQSPAAGTDATGGTGTSKDDPNNFWTSISVEISSSTEATDSSASSASDSSTSTTTVKSGWWFWSRSSTSTNTSSSSSSAADASAQMSKCDVKVSFECMRVDISRGWLRTELFYDSELTCAKGANISPGPINLVALIDPNNRSVGAPVYSTDKEREGELQLYSQFPMFPTAFILACNVVLEITGETSSVQSHFRSSSSNNSSNGYGYGPFWCGNDNYSNSSSRSSTSNSTKCETTASGCRISMKAPQIIGWVSQILPPLPRPTDEDEKTIDVK